MVLVVSYAVMLRMSDLHSAKIGNQHSFSWMLKRPRGLFVAMQKKHYQITSLLNSTRAVYSLGTFVAEQPTTSQVNS